jgi:hypothetical protein
MAGMNRHRASASSLGMIFSETRFTLFRIMPKNPPGDQQE